MKTSRERAIDIFYDDYVAGRAEDKEKPASRAQVIYMIDAPDSGPLRETISRIQKHIELDRAEQAMQSIIAKVDP